MDRCSVECPRIVLAAMVAMRRGRAAALLSLGLALLPLLASPGAKAVDAASQAWPATVQARYRLLFNGLEIGRVKMNSTTTATSYSIAGSAKLSVLFGTFTWSGSSTVSGAVEGGAPAPANYAFEWKQNKKGGTVRMEFKDRVASEIAVQPPAKIRSDTVPLTSASIAGALDPMSAILTLTKADARPPCDRRAQILDGKHRYDIVFTPKRVTRLPTSSGSGPKEVAYVCRVTYEPVAGHRDNADTKSYAANRDVEIVLRRIPGSQMLIPYSVTIPTSWGTGTMVTERIDVVTAGAGKIAFTD